MSRMGTRPRKSPTTEHGHFWQEEVESTENVEPFGAPRIASQVLLWAISRHGRTVQRRQRELAFANCPIGYANHHGWGSADGDVASAPNGGDLSTMN